MKTTCISLTVIACVQFYPELMDVARKMGTVKPSFDPNKEAGGN